MMYFFFFFFFQAEDGIRDKLVTGVQTCALPISVEFSNDELSRLRDAGAPFPSALRILLHRQYLFAFHQLPAAVEVAPGAGPPGRGGLPGCDSIRRVSGATGGRYVDCGDERNSAWLIRFEHARAVVQGALPCQRDIPASGAFLKGVGGHRCAGHSPDPPATRRKSAHTADDSSACAHPHIHCGVPLVVAGKRYDPTRGVSNWSARRVRGGPDSASPVPAVILRSGGIASRHAPVALSQTFTQICAVDRSPDLALQFPDLLTLYSQPPALYVVDGSGFRRSEEHTSELQSLAYLVCRLLLEKKKHTY